MFNFLSSYDLGICIHMRKLYTLLDTNPILVGDTNRLSCEPRGIPQKGLQIACIVTIYVNYIICKLA